MSSWQPPAPPPFQEPPAGPPQGPPPQGPLPQGPMQPFLTPAALPAPGPAEAWLVRPYPQLLRGPTYRWWRPLASVGVMLGLVVLVVVASSVILGVYSAVTDTPLTGGATEAELNQWSITPTGLAASNLLLAAGIPAAQLAVWAAYGWRPRWVSSVVGGIRWGWLARCLALSAVISGVLIGGLVALDGGLELAPEKQAAMLALVVLLTTPLQAAGEEYFFRGWLPQVIGGALRRPLVGGVVGGLVASTLFAAAHGQQDVWLFADRFGFGVIAAWLVWRTGGLEAGIALHVVNNLIAFALSILTGSMADMLEQTEGTAMSAVVDVASLAVLALVLDRWARRRGVVNRFHPPVRAWG